MSFHVSISSCTFFFTVEIERVVSNTTFKPKSIVEDKVSIGGHLIFDKEGRIYNRKKTTSLTSGAGKTGQPLVKE